MTAPLARLRAELSRGLEQRRAQDLHRALAPSSGLDLASNDVLGYARDPWIAGEVARAVREHGTGAGAARLLRGNLPIHEEAERRLAVFSGREGALLFPSGSMANAALLAGLVGPDDLVLSDRDNHASLIDGIRLARAPCTVLDVDDAAALARGLAEGRGRRRVLIAVESVVSTSGRRPDLARVVAAAEAGGALVVVDEAHATGLFGTRGSGRVEELGLSSRVAATMHTGGKALGVAGAWIAGDRVLIEHLINHARPFLFTTAPMPALAAGLIAALARRAQEPEAAAQVLAVADGLRRRLAQGGLAVEGAGTHIVSVRVGEDGRALRVARALQALGLDVRALRPPTVRPGEASLRILPRRDTPAADLERLAQALLSPALLGAPRSAP